MVDKVTDHSKTVELVPSVRPLPIFWHSGIGVSENELCWLGLRVTGLDDDRSAVV